MNASEMFPSKYLKASDLQGRTPVLSIREITIESLGSEEEKENKPVIYFEGKEKGLVCNKTNWNTLIDLFGEETDEWIGSKIKLIVSEVAFKGKMSPALRISSIKVPQAEKVAKAKAAKPEAEVAEEEDDNIPF